MPWGLIFPFSARRPSPSHDANCLVKFLARATVYSRTVKLDITHSFVDGQSTENFNFLPAFSVEFSERRLDERLRPPLEYLQFTR